MILVLRKIFLDPKPGDQVKMHLPKPNLPLPAAACWYYRRKNPNPKPAVIHPVTETGILPDP